MKITIKKYYIVGLFGFICVLTGFSLLSTFFEYLAKYNDWRVFIYLCLFIFSLFWIIMYFQDHHSKVKLAREVAEEVVNEQLAHPDLFTHTSPDTLKDQIQNHLLKKVKEEKYVLFKK